MFYPKKCLSGELQNILLYFMMIQVKWNQIHILFHISWFGDLNLDDLTVFCKSNIGPQLTTCVIMATLSFNKCRKWKNSYDIIW